jgi:hypothetical protein
VKSDGTNQKAIAYLYATVIDPENVVFLSYFPALKCDSRVVCKVYSRLVITDKY